MQTVAHRQAAATGWSEEVNGAAAFSFKRAECAQAGVHTCMCATFEVFLFTSLLVWMDVCVSPTWCTHVGRWSNGGSEIPCSYHVLLHLHDLMEYVPRRTHNTHSPLCSGWQTACESLWEEWEGKFVRYFITGAIHCREEQTGGGTPCLHGQANILFITCCCGEARPDVMRRNVRIISSLCENESKQNCWAL